MKNTRYELLENLGCGTTCRVDKARDTIIGRTVAIKTLIHAIGAPNDHKQFLREAQIIGQLSHPAIVNLYDVGIEAENVAYLVMEYVPGKTLQHLLSAPLPFPKACEWAMDLAGALGRAHRAGIIHGDVKPGNILVTEDGQIKLGDFGIARHATQLSGGGRAMGTPAYLSPEQILGQPQDARSDLFSLGIVLYQMLTGVAAFEGSSVSAVCAHIVSGDPVPPSKRNPGLPAEIDRVIVRCLAKNPADRYPTAEALAASLYQFSHGTAQLEVPRTPRPSGDKGTASTWFTRPVQKWEGWTAVAAAVLVLASIPIYPFVSRRFQLPESPAAALRMPVAPRNLATSSWVNPEPSANAEGAQIDRRPGQVTRTSRPIPSLKASLAPAAHATAPRTAPSSNSPLVPSTTSTKIPAQRPENRATLHVEIDSAVNEGAVAIFADSALLFTTELQKHAEGPVRLERTMSVGPHQLRVVLYHADKSLQTAREGLGQIRLDASNILRVHVSRRSKLLVRHQTALDISWPSTAAVGSSLSSATYSPNLAVSER